MTLARVIDHLMHLFLSFNEKENDCLVLILAGSSSCSCKVSFRGWAIVSFPDSRDVGAVKAAQTEALAEISISVTMHKGPAPS